MFKIITGKAEVGGSTEYQKNTVERAKKDFADQLNATEDAKLVGALTIFEADHEIQVIGVIEVPDAKGKGKVK